MCTFTLYITILLFTVVYSLQKQTLEKNVTEMTTTKRPSEEESESSEEYDYMLGAITGVANFTDQCGGAVNLGRIRSYEVSSPNYGTKSPYPDNLTWNG
ncbi:unnamed protein product [Allacma fusca]|uniref:Uncharacterized protein n=1 Tax=Allacma fusca TaxID=39272 RepID=A0A8J2KU72_9HEXA|nr:unnamed protein product [Allacma fusca]